MGFPYKIRISGDIGDNLVFIGKVLGEAATVFGKYYAIQSHSCGEENRGEANCTDVIISEDIIYSPSFNHPNIMLCLTQTACCEFVDRLSQDGILIFDSEKVVDCPEKHSKEYHYPIFQTARDTFGNESSACIIAIGILADFLQKIPFDSIKKALNNQDIDDLNKIKMKALNIGYELGSHKYTHKLGVG